MSYPKLSKEQIADVVAYHLMLTRESFEKRSRDLSPKALRAQTIITSGAFGCNGDAVARLVAVLLDEEIIPPGASQVLAGSIANCPAGLIMVAVQNKDGSVRGHYADGSCVPNTFHLKHLEQPTRDEVAWFFETRHGLHGDPCPARDSEADMPF